MLQVLGTAICSDCNAVKNFLTKNGVEFSYYDASSENSGELVMGMRSAGARAFPGIFIDNVLQAAGKDAIDYCLAMDNETLGDIDLG